MLYRYVRHGVWKVKVHTFIIFWRARTLMRARSKFLLEIWRNVVFTKNAVFFCENHIFYISSRNFELARQGARVRIFWKYGLSPFKRRVARIYTTISYFLESFEWTMILHNFQPFLKNRCCIFELISLTFSKNQHFWKPASFFRDVQFLN